MSKPINEAWLEKLVKNYRIPKEEEIKSNKILTESQIKIIQNGKDKGKSNKQS
jgi:hypothetical protein